MSFIVKCVGQEFRRYAELILWFACFDPSLETQSTHAQSLDCLPNLRSASLRTEGAHFLSSFFGFLQDGDDSSQFSYRNIISPLCLAHCWGVAHVHRSLPAKIGIFNDVVYIWNNSS